MLKNLISIIITLCIALTIFSCSNEEVKPYFGQEPPGDEPVIFAPGIFSTSEHEYSYPSFSPDGKEVMWSVRFTNSIIKLPVMILTMSNKNNEWSNTKIVEFSGIHSDIAGCFSADGTKFFFSSERPIDDTNEPKSDLDLWYSNKNNSLWSEPIRLNSLINTDKLELHPTIASNGNLYYVGHFPQAQNNFGIFRSEFKNGEYLAPEPLEENINSTEFQWSPFIAPDESYLLFSGTREGGYGFGDIYISVRQEDGSFGKPVNLGPKINTKYNERFPYVSPDNKYLFFTSNKYEYSHDVNNPLGYDKINKLLNGPGNGYADIYWVDISIINKLLNK